MRKLSKQNWSEIDLAEETFEVLLRLIDEMDGEEAKRLLAEILINHTRTEEQIKDHFTAVDDRFEEREQFN